MPRSHDQNQAARERTREKILHSAITKFAENGVHKATIADITTHAGVAQGLVNYHFGGKEQLIGAIADRWYDVVLGIAAQPASADDALRAVIDSALIAAMTQRDLQRVISELVHQPATRDILAAAEARRAADTEAAQATIQQIFAGRGSEDPQLDEAMIRTVLEGIVGKHAATDGSFPLERARRWMYAMYQLGEPATPLVAA